MRSGRGSTEPSSVRLGALDAAVPLSVAVGSEELCVRWAVEHVGVRERRAARAGEAGGVQVGHREGDVADGDSIVLFARAGVLAGGVVGVLVKFEVWHDERLR